MAWIKWSDQRPKDHTIPYRWKVSPRMILGLEMQPEWTSKLHFVGMGYAPGEWWPDCSNWDGHHRTVDSTLEWRPAEEGEVDPIWHGLDLLPSPFTGKPPKVVALGQWIGAPLWKLEKIGIESYLVRSHGWVDAAKMRDAWNTRAALAEVEKEA